MKCDACGAPVENGKCTYCGKVFAQAAQPPQPPAGAGVNSNYQRIAAPTPKKPSPPPPQKKKSGCGTLFWIFVVVMVFGSITGLFSSEDDTADSTGAAENASVWAAVDTPLEDFDYYIDGSELYLKKYNGHDKKVKISSVYSIDGVDYSVVSLDASFALRQVQSVIVPEGVTAVSDNMFNSSGLEFVYLPSTLAEINDSFLSYFYDVEKIYYGGSEEQWNSLVTTERGEIDAKQIVFDTDPATLK